MRTYREISDSAASINFNFLLIGGGNSKHFIIWKKKKKGFPKETTKFECGVITGQSDSSVGCMDVVLFREIWAGHTDMGVDSEHVVFTAVDFHKTTEARVNSWKKETSGILVKGRTLRKCERASVYET